MQVLEQIVKIIVKVFCIALARIMKVAVAGGKKVKNINKNQRFSLSVQNNTQYIKCN